MKETIDQRKAEQDAIFQQQMDAQYEQEMTKLIQEQRDNMKQTELVYLSEEQDIKRRRENDQWELEKRHKQEEHQLLKQNIREAFHMQRHQMQMRHHKEYEQQVRRDNFRFEELKQQQIFERKQLPKQINAEYKQQLLEMKKSMGLRRTTEDKARLKKLEQMYFIKEESSRALMKEKHMRDIETLKAEMENNTREMVEIQNEKKLQLTQQETRKIQERDEQHTNDLREWKNELVTRKESLEEKFNQQQREREAYYTSDEVLVHHRRYSMNTSISLSSVTSRSSFHEGQLENDVIPSLPRIGESHDDNDDIVNEP
jgi:hypothetical protein